ncbi:MAG: glycosyltransferase family 2 protein, partial [Cyanobacteria bacterium SZAS LIN-5]|nr:glycosyltransferase family 2 protein [Cyanobacteria bacterium SZAS LIN-5]
MLPYSVGSVLRQEFTDFEVLVVGDGCTDDSADVVNSIGDARVRWINLPVNAGHQSAANNEGLRQARGELVAYLGHDDLWFPHHLAALTNRISEGYDLV